ncbi:unnamed protein product [Hermetia illucens]|uniref:Uncharacterized protein n=1 Tax=Hermetia illucens TaxID=343691 RepID=A0A7R8YU08_HERIL|nr:unnamed protein product [Hermetia illucens]
MWLMDDASLHLPKSAISDAFASCEWEKRLEKRGNQTIVKEIFQKNREEIADEAKQIEEPLQCDFAKCTLKGELEEARMIINELKEKLGKMKMENDRLLGENTKLKEEINDWFDVLNVRVASADCSVRVKTFGLANQVQSEIITDMNRTMQDMRVKGKIILLPFQKGILQTNKTLVELFNCLEEKYVTKYIITYRLNQDILENFLSIIRRQGILIS